MESNVSFARGEGQRVISTSTDNGRDLEASLHTVYGFSGDCLGNYCTVLGLIS